ncbi:hypothetical protein [Streptomyces lanatus]|uniref:Secreted protein n=1 Tax=Streptomyces lanatus TaxID=66900 RepID=A0ABV1XSP5_9ACTN|nr:hypothetical protein [Streptomyces lanatus]GHH07111.1 hypothetical protein GCM10018780_40640 [Streptomyces lanatus]
MRRLAVVFLGVLTFFGFAAAPASAVVDPAALVTCLASDVTGLVDPSAPGVPAEIPGVGCLAP